MNIFLESDFLKIVFAFLVLILFFVLIYYVERIIYFLNEKKHIDLELSRSIEDNKKSEIRHWKKKKKNNYKILIPFTKK